jgi:hypothetical protein
MEPQASEKPERKCKVLIENNVAGVLVHPVDSAHQREQ